MDIYIYPASRKIDPCNATRVVIRSFENLMHTRLTDQREIISIPQTLFLNGVRGFAAFLVVNAHEWWLYSDGAVSPVFGYVGVETFFVLSSFLLTRNLYNKMLTYREQRASVRKWGQMLCVYFFRRFMRIYPFFVIFASGLALLAHIENNPAVDNFFKSFSSGRHNYHLLPVLTFKNRHAMLWTLPIEIMYYFMIPFYAGAIVLAGAYGWAVNVVVVFISVVASIYTERSHRAGLDQHWPTFVTGSAFGVFCVIIERFIKQRASDGRQVYISDRSKKLIDIVSSFLCVNQSWYGNLTPIDLRVFPPRKDAECISLYLGLIILKESFLPSGIARLFENQTLMFWGKISFPWYLVHWLSWKFYDPQGDFSGFDRQIFHLLRGIAFAALLHYAFEKPISKITQIVTTKLGVVKQNLPSYRQAQTSEHRPE